MRRRMKRVTGAAVVLLLASTAIPWASPAGAHPTAPSSPAARPMLSIGDRGEEVVIVQRRVGVVADGRFGPKTRRAVKAWQGAAGLVPDGIVGALTWGALDHGGGTHTSTALGSSPPTSAPKVAAAPNQQWRTIGSRAHVVKPGETWTSIAAASGSTVTDLASANRMSGSTRPPPGRRVQVPGTWRCPVPSGSFINDYGFPRSNRRVHLGNDLFAGRGTPIQAPVGGVVVRADNSLGGNAVQLYGNDGNRYYFAHLDHFGATGRVRSGTVVGYVGNSGDAATTPTHLHFEVHPGSGSAVNPYPTLTLACRR